MKKKMDKIIDFLLSTVKRIQINGGINGRPRRNKINNINQNANYLIFHISNFKKRETSAEHTPHQQRQLQVE